MRDLDGLFMALAKSRFRSQFRLQAKDLSYLLSKGLPVICQHGQDFIEKRLAAAHIPNDGRQTPFHGHPVFVAQHATACCCRGCLQKWHLIPQGRELTEQEKDYLLEVLERWLCLEMQRNIQSNEH
ncbi:MAG: DUF4186 domain-containing protein [Methylomonas sp.]|nr:MAG: DUF4186 domain-containing protein [Methylomonas sp.]